MLFVFRHCFLLWLTLWLVASWRSNRVKYCWRLKLQSSLLAVDSFFSIRTVMNETHRIATKETLKNGHQKSSSVLIYLLLQCYSSVPNPLFWSIPPFVASLHRGDSGFCHGPTALFLFSPPWARFQALQLHSSFTANQQTVLVAPHWLHNGHKNRKPHFDSLSFLLITLQGGLKFSLIAILFPSQLLFIFGEPHLFQI